MMGMMAKRHREEYLNYAIKSKIKSQLFSREEDVRYYFKHRNSGLAGISNEMVRDQAFGAVRRLRVWREIANECKYILND